MKKGDIVNKFAKVLLSVLALGSLSVGSAETYSTTNSSTTGLVTYADGSTRTTTAATVYTEGNPTFIITQIDRSSTGDITSVSITTATRVGQTNTVTTNTITNTSIPCGTKCAPPDKGEDTQEK